MDSKFYINYSKNYKELQSYVALGFLGEENIYPILTNDIRNSGLLFWDKIVINNLQNLKVNKYRLREKQLHIVGYLIELFYDVCIDETCNVSESPGFEWYFRNY